ncbi:MAG: hypothetical protein LBG83_07060 [Oscillospiraceae bacterium]|nr:hypothetical protein [Oscillospiraceae bacterium]
MKQAKRVLAILLTLALFCGALAVGAFAADAKKKEAPKPLTAAQAKELAGYIPANLPLAIVELAVGRLPKWLNWLAFSKGSSYLMMEDELKAELKKAGCSYDDLMEWIFTGDLETHLPELVKYNKVLAEKGYDIAKKHCVFYIDWYLDVARLLYRVGA